TENLRSFHLVAVTISYTFAIPGGPKLHESIYQSVLEQLIGVYKQVQMGDPLEKGTLLGPLHTSVSKEKFEKGMEIIKTQVIIFSYD
ncbi:hypothetical protein IFM89_006868, partial [Coptis chinensis]